MKNSKSSYINKIEQDICSPVWIADDERRISGIKMDYFFQFK